MPDARSGATSRSTGSKAASKGGHPKRAAAGPRQQRPVRSDREGEEGRHQQEEDERQQSRAARQGQAQLAQDQRGHPSRTIAAPLRASGWWLAARIAPPDARCARSPPRAARALHVEAVGGLVKQPQGRARGHHARQCRPLPLPGREDPHRQVGDRAPSPSPPSPARRVADPESERRRRAAGARRARDARRRAPPRPRDRSRGGREQAGGEADQGGFAGAVGAGDQRRLAGAEREAQPLEQQPAAAQAGDPLEASSPRTRPPPRWRACRRRRSRNDGRFRGR